MWQQEDEERELRQTTKWFSYCCKFGVNCELWLAMPIKRLTSLTVEGVAALTNAEIFLESGRTPSVEKIMPKNCRFCFKNYTYPYLMSMYGFLSATNIPQGLCYVPHNLNQL